MLVTEILIKIVQAKIVIIVIAIKLASSERPSMEICFEVQDVFFPFLRSKSYR